MHEPQRAQLANLTFIDRRLEGEVELIESLYVRQVGKLQTRLEIPLAARIGLRTHGLQEEVGISRLLLRRDLQQGFQPGIKGSQVEGGQSGPAIVRGCSSGASHRQAFIGFQRSLLDNWCALLNVDERFPRTRATQWNPLVVLI